MSSRTHPKQARPDGAARRWKLLMRVCQGLLAVLIVVAVWSIGFAGGGGTDPVLPDTDTQFSLDLSVIAAADHSVVYVVEQRARPAYRIFAFDPATGESTTVFTVPDDAIIYGIGLSNDGATLAVTYSPDFNLDGSGLWTLDLASGEMTMVLDVEPGIYHADPVWTTDDTAVLTTRVDRQGESEQLDVGRIEVSDGSSEIVVADAINPVVVGDEIYALQVDENQARRGISKVVDGELDAIVSGDLDLDHLVADGTASLNVAAIDTDETATGLTFGSVAQAHGNHDRPSTWWTVPVTSTEPGIAPEASTVASIIVYDAAAGDDAIVYATGEGLSIGIPATGERIDVIASRAIRFVAA